MSLRPRSITAQLLLAEPSYYETDHVGSISFVECMTDQLLLIFSADVKIDKVQEAKLRQKIKTFLDQAL